MVGEYDNVRCVLTGASDPLASRPGFTCTNTGLGYDPAHVINLNGLDSSWAESLLGASGTINLRQRVFFACGVDLTLYKAAPDGAAYAAALRDYSQRGGSLYARDWAADVIERAFPELITWYGASSSSGVEYVDNSKVGAVQEVTATVTDPALASALGQTTASISFDLPYWVVVSDAAPGVVVHLRATVATAGPFGMGGSTLTDVPLAVSASVGAGHVLFTSFHDESNATNDSLRVLRALLAPR